MEDRGKKTYEHPKLEELGKIVDLTQVGFTRPGNDLFGGSVFPPGHDNGRDRGRDR
jgi:hypothetical protein